MPKQTRNNFLARLSKCASRRQINFSFCGLFYSAFFTAIPKIYFLCRGYKTRLPSAKMYHFIFTITFKSMQVKRKERLIRQLPDRVAYMLSVFNYKNPPTVFIDYVIEYHAKKSFKGVKADSKQKLHEINNVCAPHLHGVIVSDKYLSERFIDALRQHINSEYGRTELYFQENTDEVRDWYSYIQKYVTWNDEIYGREHKSSVQIVPPVTPEEFLEDDE